MPSSLLPLSLQAFEKFCEPGKTCVVGASYVALECAGFLNALGLDTTVAVRSRLLRGFDTEYAEKIGEHMKVHGTKFKTGFTPASVTKEDSGKFTVAFKSSTDQAAAVETEEFDTVLAAVGRRSQPPAIELHSHCVKLQAVHCGAWSGHCRCTSAGEWENPNQV